MEASARKRTAYFRRATVRHASFKTRHDLQDATPGSVSAVRVLWLARVRPEIHAPRTKHLTRELAARGHDVTVLTIRTDRQSAEAAQIHGVRYRYLTTMPGALRGDDALRFYPTRLPWFLLAAPAVRLIAKRDRPDVIVEDMLPVGAPMVATAAQGLGIPWVGDVHYLLGSPRAWLSMYGLIGAWGAAYEWQLRRGSLRPDAIVTDAKDLADRLGAQTPWNRIAWIPNGIQQAILDADGHERRRDANGTLRLVTVGRCVAPKGQRYLVDAVNRVPRSSPVHLTVVGDGPLLGGLREQTSRLGEDDRIAFVGRVSHDELPAVLANADVFVMPSIAEGMPIALVEALASGAAVIATDIPGHRQVAGDDAIRFVAPADANGLAGAIVDLERDPDRREALGRAGRALVHQAYRWDAAADAYEALLHEVVTSTRRSNRT